MSEFFDDGAYFEVGMHGRAMGLAGESDDTPADGVICGFGKVDGRMVCAAAYDFTVKLKAPSGLPGGRQISEGRAHGREAGAGRVGSSHQRARGIRRLAAAVLREASGQPRQPEVVAVAAADGAAVDRSHPQQGHEPGRAASQELLPHRWKETFGSGFTVEKIVTPGGAA